MSYVLATEAYSDTSPLLDEMTALVERVRSSLGWTTDNLSALLPAWRSGNVVMVTDRNNSMLEGAAAILKIASAIHESDAMALFFAPATNRDGPMLHYCKMVAKAHGAKGLAMMLDVNAPLAFVELMGQQGFRPKAMTYGVRL